MSVYALVKERVDIVDAAQRYGMSINRHNKALCPFHGDIHPSLSFKGKRYTCFACGEGGDVIDLVGYLICARSSMETVKELNNAYHLGLNLNRPVDRRQTDRINRAHAEKTAFEQWEREACNLYARYCRALRKWKCDYAPQDKDDSHHPLFVEACTKLDYMEYLYETIFINGSVEEKKQFYLSDWLEIAFLQQRFGREKDYEAIGGVAQRNSQDWARYALERSTCQVV